MCLPGGDHQRSICGWDWHRRQRGRSHGPGTFVARRLDARAISNQVQEGRPLQFTADGLSLLTGGAPIDIAPIVQKIPNTSAINPPTIRPIALAVESVTLRRNIDLSMHK